MTLHVISVIITHKQELVHFVAWPSEVICIAKFILLLYNNSLFLLKQNIENMTYYFCAPTNMI